jgi:hypothetical protein
MTPRPRLLTEQKRRHRSMPILLSLATEAC